MLLQVLDDGRLTDGQGRTVDFRNTLIVLTSNLGSDVLAGLPEGDDVEAVRGQVMEVVRQAFRPEFLNRLDEILLFRRLSRARHGRHRRHPARAPAAAAGRAQDRARARRRGEGAGWPRRGYDPVYGARPLKRVIQRELQNPLARPILEGRIKDGDTARIGVGPKGLTVATVAADAPAEPKSRRRSA